MKLGEAMYKTDDAASEGGEGQSGAGGSAKEDVVDADFEEVDDDKRHQS